MPRAGGRRRSSRWRAGRSRPTRSARLARAGVTRVIFACAAGQGALFERSWPGLGPEIVAAEEPERLGRGGGIKFAARPRREEGDVYALNGDELVDVDFGGAARGHRSAGALATITVAQPSRSSASSTSATTTASGASARAAASRTGSTAATTCSPRRRSSGSPTGATTSRRRSPSSPPRDAYAPTAMRGSG